jgi:hypothetical protein
MEQLLAVINTLWPIAVGFTALVFWLAKSHSDIEQLKEKVRTLFDLFNKHVTNDDERLGR